MARFTATKEGQQAWESSRFGQAARESSARTRESISRAREAGGGRITTSAAKAPKEVRQTVDEIETFLDDLFTADSIKQSDSDIDWATSIGEKRNKEGFIAKFLGLSETTEYNPATGNFDDRLSKTVSPLAIASGTFGGPLGLLASAFIGDEDPLAFDIDLGFGSDRKPTTFASRHKRESDGGRGETQKPAAIAKAEAEKVAPEFGSKVREVMASTGFDFAAQPEFQLLSSDFGSDIESLLTRLQTKENT